jgi:transposase InsO family protein
MVVAAAVGPAVENASLVEEIRRVHAESDGTYGSRRVHAQLRREGYRVNLKRVERLMRVERIQGACVPAKRRVGRETIGGARRTPDRRSRQPGLADPPVHRVETD